MDAPEELPESHAPAGTTSTLAGVRLVSLCTLLSRVLGLLREVSMAWLFGAGNVSDAFTLAFRIPNLFRQLLGEGALTTAFLPRFVHVLEHDGPAAARRLSTGVLVVLSGILLAIVFAGEVAIGLSLLLLDLSERAWLLLVLLAILLPYLLVICISAQLCAVLQSLRRFFWPAMVPVLLNIAWIVSTLVAPWSSGDATIRVQLVAAGVVAGGLLQLAVPYWVLRRLGYGITIGWRESLPQVRIVFASMIPVLGGVLLSQANTVLDSFLAWVLSSPSLSFGVPIHAGTTSALYYAYRLLQFPLGVVGVALGTVLFPVLARHAKRGESGAFARELTHGLETALAVGIPASIGLILLAGPLTRALFQRGHFDADDAALTSRMVIGYGAGVWASISLLILNRAFYAVEDRATPVRISAIGVGINVILSLTLVYLVGGAGLAWATSLATAIQFGFAFAVVRTRIGSLDTKSLIQAIGRTVVATSAMAAACLMVRTGVGTDIGTVRALIAPLLVSVAVYLLTAKVIDLTHPWELIRPRSKGERGASAP
jgi:putative peptidoglycan lipid II flippase